MTDELKGNTRPPTCSDCRGPVEITYMPGMMNDGTAFITPNVRPCRYCQETARLRGWHDGLGHLIEERS